MQPELIIFLLMVGSFMLSCFAFKLSAGIGMVIGRRKDQRKAAEHDAQSR